MDKIKEWLKKNWSTALLAVVFIVLLVNPDAKAWFMRQIISTGIMNAEIKDRKETTSKEVPVDYPLMSVKHEDGTTISTAELKGKVVFINFWASWCPPCRAEFPSIQKFYEKYRSNKDVIFLTVNMDDDVSLGKNYLQKENYTLPLLVPQGNIPEEYFSGSLPTTVVLDKTGSVRLHHAGMADYSKASFYEQINSLIKE